MGLIYELFNLKIQIYYTAFPSIFCRSCRIRCVSGDFIFGGLQPFGTNVYRGCDVADLTVAVEGGGFRTTAASRRLAMVPPRLHAAASALQSSVQSTLVAEKNVIEASEQWRRLERGGFYYNQSYCSSLAPLRGGGQRRYYSYEPYYSEATVVCWQLCIYIDVTHDLRGWFFFTLHYQLHTIEAVLRLLRTAEVYSNQVLATQSPTF